MLPLSEITEVASLSWGRALSHPIFYLLVNVFAFCAMLTSFWVISESFLTNMVDQFKLKDEFHVPTRIAMLAFIVLPPFLLAFFGAVSFVNAIFFAGTFGGIIMSILPVFMLRGARRSGDMDPVWTCGRIADRPIQILLIVIFSAAGLYALASMAGMLPAGW
jgi:amino acid permease